MTVETVIPTEAQEARELMRFMRQNALRFTHIKNETGRSPRGKQVRNWRAVWDKRDGVSAGFPDFIVLVNNRIIAIELKRTKNSSTSLSQKQWLEALNKCGVPAQVCKGAEEAKLFIKKFMVQDSNVF